MMVNGEENFHQQWNNDEHDPGTFTELSCRKYDHHDRSTEGAETIDQHFVFPARLIFECRTLLNNFLALFQMANLPPAARHARLRKCKGKKHADSVERN